MVGKKGPRKLLVASIGVATINYVLAGCGSDTTVANLMAPNGGNSSAGKSSGGASGTAGTGVGGGIAGYPTVANLPAPIIGGNGGSGGAQ